MFNEKFLQLYNEELRYLREAGDQFANDYPQVAKYLGMHLDGVQDPFVERLLEGTAFLATRVQEKLNSEQPEFALQMLSRLAPLWYTPVPSITTVAIKPDLSYPQWQQPVELPRGSKLALHDISLNNKPATFTTSRTIQLQPVEIECAECTILPPQHVPSSVAYYLREGLSYLRLALTTRRILPISELDLSPLHLTLSGDAVQANQLLSVLLNKTLRIVVWSNSEKAILTKVLTPEQLVLGGLSEDEALLPTAISELPGSRLMREYFASPSRFLSLELYGLSDFLAQCEGQFEFEIMFVLNQRPLQLIDRISVNDFDLFATPAINLYRRKCSPIQITGEKTEYPLIVDRLNTQLYGIHHIQNIKGILQEGQQVTFSSLHNSTHYQNKNNRTSSLGYAVRRRPAIPSTNSKYHNVHLPDEDLFVSFSSGKNEIDIDSVSALIVDAMVCERHLIPSHLQQPVFQLEAALPIHDIQIIRHPSQPRGVPNIDQVWQAIQLVSMNPLRFSQPKIKDCVVLLHEWLSLFCHQEDLSQQKRITSLKNATISHQFERYLGTGPLAWVRSAQLLLNIKSGNHPDNGAYLFGKVIHHALAEYCELNQMLSMKILMDDEFQACWRAIGYE